MFVAHHLAATARRADLERARALAAMPPPPQHRWGCPGSCGEPHALLDALRPTPSDASGSLTRARVRSAAPPVPRQVKPPDR